MSFLPFCAVSAKLRALALFANCVTKYASKAVTELTDFARIYVIFVLEIKVLEKCTLNFLCFTLR